MRMNTAMRMNVLGALLPVLLLILNAPSGTAAFSTPWATVPYSRTTIAGNTNTNTRLHQSSVTNNKKVKKNKYEDVDNEEELPTSTSPGLPPALSLNGLTCSHDGGTVFQLRDVSYVLPRTAKVGLVGRNGCGKSTLMKILAETCCTDRDPASFSDEEGVRFTGKIECPRDVRVAFVEQEPPSPSDITVADALLGVVSSTSNVVGGQSKSVFEAVRRYCRAASALEYDEDEFSTASSEMDSKDGWSVLTKADEIATRLRVDHLKEMPLSKLSGGERKRVALGAALVQRPDVLLLDEPTNHLDLEAIRLLSDLISDEKKMTLLTITHDRAFLNEVCDRMLELDNGSLYGYEGNYGDYLEGKEARLAIEDKEMSSTKKKFANELAWMRKQPSGRQSKSKARQEAFYKLEKMTKPRAVDPNLVLTNDARRIGGNILKLKNVSKQFGDRLMLDDFSYDFNAGDSIGVVGANGVGKSTFLKLLTGALEVDSGVVETGETVVFGIYDQMGMVLDESQRVMDFVKQRVLARDGSTMAEAPGEVMKLLKQFQFPKERWNDVILRLSGGERRRLQLLAVLTQRPNFLILDEPTNDVDLDTLSALEDYLAEFNGVLVIVSHDRFFVDKVTEHLFVFEGEGAVKDYLGSLSDYAETLVDEEKASKRK
jgi:ATP-binding cassette subfamily F protein uup